MPVDGYRYVLDGALKTQCLLLDIQVWLSTSEELWVAFYGNPETHQWLTARGETPDRAVRLLIEQLSTIGDRFK